jgi:hypothetical protein
MFDSNSFGNNYFDRPLVPSSTTSKKKTDGGNVNVKRRKRRTSARPNRPKPKGTTSNVNMDSKSAYKNYVFKKLRTKSENPNRAMDAVFVNVKTGKEKIVSFGKNGQCTFLTTKDPSYKAWYRQNHSYNEDELMSPNALTNLVLFNKLTIEESLKDYKNKLRRAGDSVPKT